MCPAANENYGKPAPLLPATRPAMSTWKLALGLFLLIVIAYAPAIGHGFIWDDGDYLLENRLVQRDSGPAWIWLSPELSTGQYHPLTFTTFWAEWRLWHTWMPGYHATNILLHACGGLIAWRIFRRLNLRAAWLAAAVFALHPQAVESVAWVAERKNILALILGLLSILAYLRMRKVGSADQPDSIPPWRLYAFSFVAFALSLFSKPVFCGVPLIIALLLYMTRHWRWKDALLLAPHTAAAVIMSLVCSYFEVHYAGAKGAQFALSIPQRFSIAGLDIFFYLGKFLCPYPLYQGYPKWQVTPPATWTLLLFPAALVILAVLWTLRRRIGRGPSVGAAITLVALAPSLGFVSFYPMTWTYVADHYAYFALPALAALLVETAARHAAKRPVRAPIPTFAAAALVTVLFALTVFQSSLYRSGERLWTYTLSHYPQCALAEGNLANTLLLAGRPADALPHARRATEIAPGDAVGWLQYAIALDLTGHSRQALRALAPFEALSPNDSTGVQLRAAFTAHAATQPAARDP